MNFTERNDGSESDKSFKAKFIGVHNLLSYVGFMGRGQVGEVPAELGQSLEMGVGGNGDRIGHSRAELLLFFRGPTVHGPVQLFNHVE